MVAWPHLWVYNAEHFCLSFFNQVTSIFHLWGGGNQRQVFLGLPTIQAWKFATGLILKVPAGWWWGGVVIWRSKIFIQRFPTHYFRWIPEHSLHKKSPGITDPIRILVLGLCRLVSSFYYLYYFAPALLPTARKWKIVWWQIFIEYISAIDDKDLLFGYFCRNLIKRKRTECDNWANEEKTKRWHEKMLRVEQKSQIRDRGCIARPSGRRRRSI